MSTKYFILLGIIMAIDTGTSIQTAVGAVTAPSSATNALQSAIASASTSGVISAVRSASIPVGGEVIPASAGVAAKASFGNILGDWRVSLGLVLGDAAFLASPILLPITLAGGLVFPYTPQINIGTSATYVPQSPVHSNSSFKSFKSSEPAQIKISAPMYVEDAEQALYWLAAVHYLRSLTKMYTGTGTNTGNPPPIVRLNGYGPYVFNHVPVVVTQFSVQLNAECDYISATALGVVLGHVPTKSALEITLQPMYSKDNVRKFSLQAFATGAYIVDPFAGYM